MVSLQFSLETPKNDPLKVQITFSLFDLKHSCEKARQESICKYLLTCLLRLYPTKTENLATRFISNVDHFDKEHVPHPVPTERLYQHRNSVQIMVHKHGKISQKLNRNISEEVQKHSTGTIVLYIPIYRYLTLMSYTHLPYLNGIVTNTKASASLVTVHISKNLQITFTFQHLFTYCFVSPLALYQLHQCART